MKTDGQKVNRRHNTMLEQVSFTHAVKGWKSDEWPDAGVLTSINSVLLLIFCFICPVDLVVPISL